MAAVSVASPHAHVVSLDAIDGDAEPQSPAELMRVVRRAFDHTANLPSPPDDEELRSVCVSAFLTSGQRNAVAMYRKACKLQPQEGSDALPDLSEQEVALVQKLRTAAEDICEDDRDRLFALDSYTLLRYLRAREWSLDNALKMLHDTVVRRRTSCPEKLHCKQCVEDFPCGDIRFIGWDLQQRPIAYSSFARSRNRNTENAVTHTVSVMEKTRLLASSGHPCQICWITHFAGFGWRDLHPGFAIAAAKTFMNDYPEMLGLFIAVDAPRIFHPMWQATSAILNERTRKKVVFLETKAGREATLAALGQHMGEEQAEHVFQLLQRDRDHLAGK